MTTACSRRRFLAASAGVSLGAVALNARLAAAQHLGRCHTTCRSIAPVPSDPADPAVLKTLAAAALDAAKAAGATYTDVRFRFTQHENWTFFRDTSYPVPRQEFVVGVGVRALVRGYWGWSAIDGIATTDHMAQLGRAAAAQAVVNAQGPARPTDLAPTPIVHDGVWTMPVAVDPFTVSYEEKADFMCGVGDYFARQALGVTTQSMLDFVKEARTFASSDGSFCTQTVFTSGLSMGIGTDADWMTERGGGRLVDLATPAGAGWEYIIDTPFEDRAPAFIDEALRQRRAKPVVPGRYDVVFDAFAMASIIDATISGATELTRAMGYDADDSGTSYLGDPLAMLGTYRVSSPLVTLSATRSLPGGAATVKWDDEGVEPIDTTLVTRGTLTDFQTTRESASWLAPYYQKVGRAVRSSGGAGADRATTPTKTWPANYVLAHDATHDTSFDDLVANTKTGYAVKGGSARADFQCLNGWASGNIVYEIRNGKLGNTIMGAQVLFRAPEFWKNVSAIGGVSSAETVGARSGSQAALRLLGLQSAYTIPHSVRAVPAQVSGLAVVDARRRA